MWLHCVLAWTYWLHKKTAKLRYEVRSRRFWYGFDLFGQLLSKEEFGNVICGRLLYPDQIKWPVMSCGRCFLWTFYADTMAITIRYRTDGSNPGVCATGRYWIWALRCASGAQGWAGSSPDSGGKGWYLLWPGCGHHNPARARDVSFVTFLFFKFIYRRWMVCCCRTSTWLEWTLPFVCWMMNRLPSLFALRLLLIVELRFCLAEWKSVSLLCPCVRQGFKISK